MEQYELSPPRIPQIVFDLNFEAKSLQTCSLGPKIFESSQISENQQNVFCADLHLPQHMGKKIDVQICTPAVKGLTFFILVILCLTSSWSHNT